jgi:hypothetical protein
MKRDVWYTTKKEEKIKPRKKEKEGQNTRKESVKGFLLGPMHLHRETRIDLKREVWSATQQKI